MRILKTVALVGATLCSFSSAFAAEKITKQIVVETKQISLDLKCANQFSLEEGTGKTTGDFRLIVIVEDDKVTEVNVFFYLTEKVRQVGIDLFRCRGMEVPQELASATTIEPAAAPPSN